MEQEWDQFPLNTSTAKHFEWKTGSGMHPGTSALCYPSKIKRLEMFGFGFFASFILIFVVASVWEELRGKRTSCLGQSLRKHSLEKPGRRAAPALRGSQTPKWVGLRSLTEKPRHSHGFLHAHGLGMSGGTGKGKETFPLHGTASSPSPNP